MLGSVSIDPHAHTFPFSTNIQAKDEDRVLCWLRILEDLVPC